MENDVIVSTNIIDEPSYEEVYEYKDKKLWDPTGILVISILFSFLPASILYALNCGRLGNTKKRNVFMVFSIILFAAFYTVLVFVQSRMVSLFPVLNIGFGIYMRSTQIGLYKNHIINSGKKASFVLPIIIILIFVALVVALAIYSINIPHQMRNINGDELYYTKSINDKEVDDLGKFLTDVKFFVDDSKTVSVKIDKVNNTYLLSFVIVDKVYLNDKETFDTFKSLGEYVSDGVFNKNKVIVQLCDDRFNVLKKIE